MDCRTALLVVLDQVDYTRGACSATEMVGAVLSKEVIALARKAIAVNYHPVNGVASGFDKCILAKDSCPFRKGIG